jgi:hypothetical protein
MNRYFALAAASIVAVLAITACGGDDDGDSTATTSPTAQTASPTPQAGSPIATGSPTPSGAASPGTTSSPTAGSFGSLAGLSSYRYELKMELKGLETAITEGLGALGAEEVGPGDTVVMDIRGAYVSPDKAEIAYKVTGLDEEIAIVVIGTNQWVKLGDLIAGPTPYDGSISDLNLVLSFWDEGFLPEAGGVSCSGERRDTINGVSARRCEISQATFDQLSALFGGSSEDGQIQSLSFEAWLHESEGWPVRLNTQVVGTDETGQQFDVKVQLEVKDVGTSINIQPPSP